MTRLLLLYALALAAAAPVLAQPDLNGRSVIPLDRSSGFPGDSLLIPIIASNSGTQAAPDFPAAVYFSNDRIISADDIFLTRVTVPAVGPQSNSFGGARTVVPQVPRGGYYVLVALDDPNTVPETDETNNVNSARFTVSPAFGGPDLIPDAATLEDTEVEPGGRVSVDYVVVNAGQSDVGDFDAAFYIALGSEFVTPRSEWILLERETIGGLDAGESNDESEQITVPMSVPPGDYSFFVILDDRNLIAEISETNNTYALGLRVTGATAGEAEPGAAMLTLRASPNPAGGAVSLGYTLPTAGPVQIKVYDALGRRIALVADGERGAGAHAEALDTSRLPPGVYAARLVVDGAAAFVRFSVAR